jgi:hypothetical protein
VTPGTYSIPAIGEANSKADPLVKTFIESWNGKLNAENDLEDTGLASPNNGAYRTLQSARQSLQLDVAAGTYLMGNASTVLANGANTSTIPFPFFYFDDADYTVANKTQKLRLRAQIAVNATKLAIKVTVGLYPLTVAGGADEFKPTLGTVVSGSTVEFNEPAASTVSQGNSGDFTIPSDGAYAFGYVTSGTVTNNNLSLLSAQLQTRSV